LLNDLWYWEIKAIIAGYRKRDQQAWERTRWQTFMLMHNGMVDLSKAGITSPLDLLRFPWDDEEDGESPASDMPTKEEIEQLRKELNEHNARLAASSAPASAPSAPSAPVR
jgi:hypothetical protein